MKHVDDGVDGGAVPPTSTINTYAGYADSILRHKKRRVCVYDGGETGSIHGIGAVELPVGDDRKSSKSIDANEQFALAA